MASDLENRSDLPPEGDPDWERWESSFRAARPVLPDAALERIEAAIRKALPVDTPARYKGWRWIAIAIAAIAVAFAVYFLIFKSSSNGIPGPAPSIQDKYSVPAPPGSPLVAPDQPVLPLDRDRDLLQPFTKPT